MVGDQPHIGVWHSRQSSNCKSMLCFYFVLYLVLNGMQSLKRQRNELDAESKRIRLQLRAAARKAKASTRVNLREPALSIARALVVAHAGEPTAPAEYVRRSRRGAHSDTGALDMTAVKNELRAWWAGADATTRERYRVISDDNVCLHNAIRTANKFMIDAELEGWVENQNIQKGISPAPGVMISRANEIKTKFGVLTAKSRKGCRKWVARWRRRRSVHLRSLPTQQKISEEEMHGKVIDEAHHRRSRFMIPPFSKTRTTFYEKRGSVFRSSF